LLHYLVDRGSTATMKGEVHLTYGVGVERMTRALGTNLYVRRKRSWSETNQSDAADTPRNDDDAELGSDSISS
jgi:hypothetical protein